MAYRVSLTLLLVTTLWLLGCGKASSELDAVVDPQGRAWGDLSVYTHIQAALDAAPRASERPHRILVREGDYREKLVIAKPHLQLIGEGVDKTRIHYDDYAGRDDGDGGTLGTFRTYVVKVAAPDVQLHSLTIENDFDFVANDALPSGHAEKRSGTQAVALHLDDASDRFLAREVKLLGHQDTLYANSGRAWFDSSIIAGSVDFIFGAGNAVFSDSAIVTRARGRTHSPHGYVTAPSTDIESPFGFTFINSQLRRESGVPDNSTALGRPWHPTRTFDDGRYADPDAIGKAVFLHTRMDAHITEAGWDRMAGTAREGEGRDWFYPEGSRFFEYDSHGPGEHRNEQRRTLSAQERAQYTLDTIFGDWQPHVD